MTRFMELRKFRSWTTWAWLPVCNLVAALALLLHIGTVCPWNCDRLPSGAIFHAPLAVCGLLTHLLIFGVGCFALRLGDWVRLPYTVSVIILQGVSLHLAILLIARGEWCLMCFIAHAAMFAQLMLLCRIKGCGLHVGVLSLCLGVLACFMIQWSDKKTQVEEILTALDQSTRHLGINAGHAHSDQAENSHGKAGDSATERYEVLCHMNFVCPSCRKSWEDMVQLIGDSPGNAVHVNYVFTWPMQPSQHHGARLAAYAVYVVGYSGEQNRRKAVSKLFERDGLDLINSIQRSLQSLESRHSTAEVEEEALERLFLHIGDSQSSKKMLAVYRERQFEIGQRIHSQVSWIMRFGTMNTPSYYLSDTVGGTREDARPLYTAHTFSEVIDFMVAEEIQASVAH